jgi:hypothetical protein
MQDVFKFVGGIIPFVLVVWLFVLLFGKAGFNKWWGLCALLLFPIPFMVILLGVLPWPVRKEVVRLRIAVGQMDPQDAEDLQAQALAYYNGGNLVDAEWTFRYIADKWPTTPTGVEAKKMIELIGHQRNKTVAPPELPVS